MQAAERVNQGEELRMETGRLVRKIGKKIRQALISS